MFRLLIEVFGLVQTPGVSGGGPIPPVVLDLLDESGLALFDESLVVLQQE
jgi:hypothetical protein